METTNNTMPLWRKLNEERTQGEWVVKTGHFNRFNIGNGGEPVLCTLLPSYKVDVLKGIDELPMVTKISESNALYAALAVNNLHKLAEAMETVKSVLESWDNTTNQAKYRNLIFHMETALNRIS